MKKINTLISYSIVVGILLFSSAASYASPYRNKVNTNELDEPIVLIDEIESHAKTSEFLLTNSWPHKTLLDYPLVKTTHTKEATEIPLPPTALLFGPGLGLILGVRQWIKEKHKK